MGLNDADQLVAEWLADKFGFPVSKFDRIEFKGWLGCYSSWTCDYGVDAIVYRTDGVTHRLSGWDFPSLLTELAEYDEAQEKLEREHEASHRWDW